MSDYSRWYKDGDATVTNGSKTATGTGTYWSTAGVKAGDMITFDGGNSFREIASVNSDTSLTLAANWNGSTQSKASYAIVRNFTSGTVAEVSSQVSDFISYYRRYISDDMQKIEGKSAYEVAKANGYSGTESQWLESLKGAGEITEINAKLDNFYSGLRTYGRNSLVRFNYDLGTAFTDEQKTAISSGTFDGLWLGARWRIPGTTCYLRIIGFNHFSMTQSIATSDNTTWLPIGNHIVVEMTYWDDSAWGIGKFFADDDNPANGLPSWYIYKTVMPHFLEVAEGFFGADHIQPLRTQIADAMTVNNSGGILAPSHYKITEDKIFLEVPSQITGHPFNDELSLYGESMRRQFPLFKYILPTQSDTNASPYWLAMIAPKSLNPYCTCRNYDIFEYQHGKNATAYKFYLLVK